MPKIAVVLLCLTAGFFACSKPTENRAVVVFAAASTVEPVEALARAFERANGIIVRVNTAGSSVLARQIESGAPADVFLSASSEWVDYLDERDLVSERRDLLGNRLVVVVPLDSKVLPRNPEELRDDRITRLAVADPDAVPAGIYARQALIRLGLWEELRKKLVPGGDVRETLLAVERGEAEAGVVYATDAAASELVRVAFELDPTLSEPIRYPVALLKGSRGADAKRFYEYLASAEAAEAFRRSGFEVKPLQNP